MCEMRYLIEYIEKLEAVVDAAKSLRTSHRLDDANPKDGESFYVLTVESHKRLVSAIEKLEEQ